MIKMKAGGMILTGVAAFLVANKAVSSMGLAVTNACEAAKWRGYYKCWSKGKAEGEPVPPGYSKTVRPDKADYEVVFDPEGKDHTRDNAPEEPQKPVNTDTVKAVCETVKAVAEKVINELSVRRNAPEGAKEAQTEAFCEDSSEKPSVNEKIEEIFSNGDEKNNEETWVDRQAVTSRIDILEKKLEEKEEKEEEQTT